MLPSKLYATQIETLMRDPYRFYAKHILKLKPREMLDRAVEPQDFGKMLHHVLATWMMENAPSEGLFFELAKNYMDRYWGQQQRFTWELRLQNIYPWIHEQWEMIKDQAKVSEHTLEHRLIVEGRGYTIAARADLLLTGLNPAVIDYKTGALPSANDVKEGYAPQLPVTLWLWWKAQGLEAEAIYWKIAAHMEASEVKKPIKDSTEAIAQAEEGMKALLSYFAREDSHYHVKLHEETSDHRDDYEHLSRFAEWN